MIPSFHAALRTRAISGLLACAAMASTAAAATLHSSATSSTTGSEGAQTTLQTSATSSAFQGEVASKANGAIKIPFGVLGEYDASTSTFGIGVAGISTSGYGVAAEAFGANPSLLAESGGQGDAIDAVVPSGNGADALVIQTQTGYGVIARTQGNGVGVLSQSSSGDGVIGTSNSQLGVYGFSQSNSGIEGSSGGNSSTAGVIGLGNSNAVGVAGTSTNAAGVAGTNQMTNGSYTLEASSSGVYGQSQMGAGVYGNSASVGVYGNAPAGNAAVFSNNVSLPTVFISNGSSQQGAYLLFAAAGSVTSTNGVFTVDTSGNLYAAGSLTSGTNTVNAVSRNPGSAMVTYAAQQAEASMEDVGSARLANGIANVPLAADFRQTIDTNASYAVFLTPHGDCRGLYVASESPSGFVVRESQGGRTTLAFDYRIVAHPYGGKIARLPHVERRSLAGAYAAVRRLGVPSGARVAAIPSIGIARNVRAHADNAIARAQRSAARFTLSR